MDGLQGLHLMLVEDEYVLALGVADTLGDLGAVVLGPVATVDDALSLVDRVPEMDAAILDVNLGGEVVYPVADALAARGIPFLFATANDPSRLPDRFAHVGVCRKPFRVDTLRQCLAGLPPVAAAARRVA